MADPYMPTKAKTEEHETPDDLFRELDDKYHFTLDAAASPQNAKVKKYYTKEDDGLKQSWEGERVWLNPPYDVKNLTAFADKALSEQDRAELIIMLLPVKTDQDWWHRLWDRFEDDPCCVGFRWCRGRLKFKGNKHSAPFPSLVVLLRNRGNS